MSILTIGFLAQEEPLPYTFIPLEPTDFESIEWALVDDSPIHISQVDSSIRNSLCCTECKQRMIARKGSVRRWHFSHFESKVGCSLYSPETREHFNTKMSLYHALRDSDQKLLRVKTLCKTPSKLGHTGPYEFIWINGWDDVRTEASIGPVRPDIVLYREGRPIGAIEVFVSHKVPTEKANSYESLGIPWIEISSGTNLDSKSPQAPNPPLTWKWDLRNAIDTLRTGPEHMGCPVCAAFISHQLHSGKHHWNQWLKLIESAMRDERIEIIWNRELTWNNTDGDSKTLPVSICDLRDSEGRFSHRILCLHDHRWCLICVSREQLQFNLPSCRLDFRAVQRRFCASLREWVDVTPTAWRQVGKPGWNSSQSV